MLVVGPALLSEVIDYATWKEGDEKAATYFSFYQFSIKVTMAIGSALGLALLGWSGFDATATAHSEDSVWTLVLVMSWLPTLFALVALIFIVLIPMNARRYGIIRRRLDSRQRRLERATACKATGSDSIDSAIANTDSAKPVKTLTPNPAR